VSENLVLLHGFGGTRRTWDSVTALLDAERYTPLALDLPGHGAAATSREPLTFAACVEHVLAASPPRFTLCGYSLGGRIALHAALAAPERVERLVLVSCTAGIDGESDRATRRAADHALADDLEQRPFAEFVERWRAQPVFAEDPEEVHEAMRVEQLRNDPRALAAVLRGVGVGEMTPLWDRLSELRMPVAVLVGRRDAKFHEPGRRMATLLADATLRLVPGGHRLPLENPLAIVRALDSAAR
jgi:2-succinyl-6-hydroxy-2,4-cyclohexadiene-1-carboxylate synthase